MDATVHTVLNAAIIASLLLASRRLGEHIAGLLSGLPITTVPALWMVSSQRGAGAAADLAAGGIVGCALAALFAVAYHAASRRWPHVPALLTALAALAAGMSPFLRHSSRHRRSDARRVDGMHGRTGSGAHAARAGAHRAGQAPS